YREDGEPELDAARTPLLEVLGAGRFMKTDVTDHLPGAPKPDRSKQPMLQGRIGVQLPKSQQEDFGHVRPRSRNGQPDLLLGCLMVTGERRTEEIGRHCNEYQARGLNGRYHG